MVRGIKSGPHKERRLSAAFVRSVKDPGRYPDGHGLVLVVDPSGAKRWSQRIIIQGKRRELGHGSASLVSLAEARERALDARKLARDGGDPLAQRRRRLEILSFAAVAKQVHEAKLPTWKNPKHGDQWINTLSTYVFPMLGDRQVSDISVADVQAVIMPIWTSKTETARRVRGRMGEVFQWAIAQGWRSDNPAEAVKAVLPKISRSKTVVPRKALDYEDIQDFLENLHASKAYPSTRLGLEFLILSAARSGEVRGARWSEIDWDKAEWTIPKDRMKAGEEHRVPLTSRMMEILQGAKALFPHRDLIFPSKQGEKALSENTFQKLVRELGYDIHVHGFRSTFRTWAQDHTDFPREVVEAALAHQEGNKVVAAYARSDLFAKRAKLMGQWQDWCTTV